MIIWTQKNSYDIIIGLDIVHVCMYIVLCTGHAVN